MTRYRDDVAALATPLTDAGDFDELLDRAGNARVVMLGEASHGTHEFYRWRALLTRRLVAELGFSFVAVEGDWPDCDRVDRAVRCSPDAEDPRAALVAFERWPTWMWANEEVVDFCRWLRVHNAARDVHERVGFHGLDVYSLWASLREILVHLREHDPAEVPTALAAYRCFEPYGESAREYAQATRFVPTSCEDQVVDLLVRLRERAAAGWASGERGGGQGTTGGGLPPGEWPGGGRGVRDSGPGSAHDSTRGGAHDSARGSARGSAHDSAHDSARGSARGSTRGSAHDSARGSAFGAWQNAEVVAGAERYYRAMVAGGRESWNVRDRHMDDTLARLLAHYGPGAKAVVWAHNTHVGDARATTMADRGEVNTGQLARERYGDDQVVLVGFGTHHGTVVAAGSWGAPTRELPVPPARPGSLEDVLHRTAPERAVLTFPRRTAPGRPDLLTDRLDHRAIGVVYHPERERWGNYVPTTAGDRYDAFVWVDQSRALHPLHTRRVDVLEPETYPTGT
ncbi:erythromycin esterase family protein [Saccharothrix syringae]|uniref:Erythromycin esterase family protein n=1 Tax=Saccharothrix syringae TaxID=103733 RepID=A0A5Q0H007_SACSY|nr:erythromycin esterase family protein [Saccharothrix syringae]QFZ19120.1 erythromycin esterase family protein [Saccharothrix syringae]